MSWSLIKSCITLMLEVSNFFCLGSGESFLGRKIMQIILTCSAECVMACVCLCACNGVCVFVCVFELNIRLHIHIDVIFFINLVVSYYS